MTAKKLLCACFVLSAFVACVIAAPPIRIEGNPHPFYENPYPLENGEMEGLDEQPFGSENLKRNPAPPSVDCTACCQDLWCSYINTRCLCTPHWNIGP